MNQNKLHPDVQQVLTLLEDLGVPDFYKGTPEKAREMFQSLRPSDDVLPPIHHREEFSVPVTGGEIQCRFYRPDTDAKLPVMVWYHGGGWVFGDLEAGEMACRQIANETQCAVVNVDYRLAPESRFPVALEDCIAATDWVRNNADSLNIDASRLAVGGDSAGGNLAAGVAQYARDHQWPMAMQLLVYPVTQPDTSLASYQRNATGYFLSQASMQWFWDHYIPDKKQRNDPRVSPLMGKLDGLAPAWVLTCEFDPLCDDGLRYADAMENAGVVVERCHLDDAIHGVFGWAIAPAVAVRSRAATALSQAFS